jgi:hypothetical protein
MSASKFHDRAIQWLRNERHLDTEARMGTHLIQDASGGARVEGCFAPPSSAGKWAFGGLCVLALGSVLIMLNSPGISSAMVKATDYLGFLALVVGAGCLVAAEVKRRRNRTPALIELRAKTAARPTADSIAALREKAGGVAWLVAERRLSREVLDAAARHGVRCFVLERGRFHEASEPSHRPSAPAQADA